MKKQFLSKAVPRGTRTLWRYLGALFILFTLAIGNVMADEIFSWTATSQIAKNASEDATGGTVKCTGSGFGSETPSGSGFYKFNSSTQLTCTLSSGTFAAGDEITFTFTSAGNNKTVGVEIQETSPVTQLTEKIATAGTSVSKTYTVTASDGIQGQNKFSIKRVDSNFSLGGVSVTRSSGGGSVYPETLTISSKDSKTAFTEGDAIELTAALAKGNGDISYQWYKGGTAEGNKLTGKNTNKLQIASCTTADEGSYYCVASKTSCDDAVNTSGFAITVEADTKCFNMPAITSKPADLASVVVTGGTLSDVSTAKSVAMNANGLKLDGNSVYLKVTLADASIIAGTKITVAWKGAGSGAGIAVVNGDLAEKVIDETGVEAAGSVTHTFTAAEAANYADEFIIHRNASGTGIYVNAITVEDCGPAVTKHTITLNYNDGATPDGTFKVVDGNAAVKPADPTRGKYTFLGWFVGDTDTEYVWSTAVTDDITLKAHWQNPWTLTFDADGGSEVADITVKHNTKAEKPADPTKDDNDFLGWFYGSPAVAFDWDANVTQNYALVAHWQLAVAKYDVEYYDGETKIGTEEQVWANAHPTAAGINTNKPLYTFVGWYTSSTLEGDPVNLNTVTPVEGLKLYGKWAKAYATSYDMEAYAVSDGASKAGLETALTAAGYAYTNINGIDNGHTHNYTYDGMKYKTNDGDLSFNVVAGKVVEVKTGHLPSDDAVTMYINGVADATVFEGADEEQETHKINYFYSAAEALYRLDVKASKGTCSVKKITIRDPYTVSYNPHGADAIDAQNATPSVTLPTPVNGTGNFKGWYDAETEGNKIGNAGASYTPTANITLHAQWEVVSTDNTLSDLQVDGATVAGFDPAVQIYNLVYEYGQQPVITSATATAGALATVTTNNTPVEEATFKYVQVKVVAESGAERFYQVRYTNNPKQGATIFKAELTSNTAADYSGMYADGDNSEIKLADDGANGYKFAGKSNYIKMAINDATFAEGDMLKMTYTTNPQQGELAIYDGTTKLQGTAYGNHILTFSDAADGKSTLFIRRTDDNNFNGWVAQVEVQRYMAPFIESFEIEGIGALDINPTTKAITATVPESFDVTALEPTIKAWANGSAHLDKSGAQDFTNPVTYTVTSDYAEDGEVTYTVTITKVAPSATPVIATQPAGANYVEGASVEALEVEATGAGTLSYQWQVKNGEEWENIDGATAASYTPAVSAIGSYTYRVVVTNTEESKPATSLNSNEATIVIAEDPSCKAIGYGTARDLAKNVEVVIDATTGLKHISSVSDYDTGKKISGESNLTTVKLGGSSAYYDIYTTEKNIGSIALSLTSSSNGEDKRYKYAVIFCKSATFAAADILGVVEQTGGAGDDEQVINTPEVPLGTKLVRIMRQYTYGETTYGQGNSSYIYYIRACLVEPAQEVVATVTAEPAGATYCPSDAVAALNYALSIEEGASAAYQWYKGTDAIDGANASTYTPSETGVYTCKASLTKTGRLPKELTSAEATVNFYEATAITAYANATGTVGSAKTLSVTAEGAGTLTYKWQACDENGNVTAETVLGTEASYAVTITAEPQYYLVTVHGECGDPTQVLSAKEWHEVELQDVTGSMTWNLHKSQNPDAWGDITSDITVSATTVMANIDNGIIPNNNSFRSDMLKLVVGEVQTKIRKGTDNGVIQGNEIMFHTTVPGIVIVSYRGTGNSAAVTLTIGSETLDSYQGGMTTSKKVFVPAGDVVISSGADAFRIQKIQFIAEPDFPRAVTEGRYGTICLPNGGVMTGATLYEIAYYEASSMKIFFDEIINGTMEAGVPYIYLPNENATQLGVFYTDAASADAGHYNGLYGSYTKELLAQNGDNYILKNNQYYVVNSDLVYVGENHAYIKISEVPNYASAPAPGRRRISMDVHQEEIATGFENLEMSEKPVKLMIDGQIFILRGEKMYDATGRLVK